MDKKYKISAIIGALVNITLNSVLIPNYGATGAAIGTLAAEAVVCIYQCLKCRNKIDLSLLVKKSFIFIFAGVVMFIILFCIKLLWLDSLLLRLAFKIILGIIIYFLVIFLEEFIARKIMKKNLLDIVLFNKEL